LFVLQWREIFGEDFLDTWQVRSSNLLSILREIEDVARVARIDHAPAQAALPALLNEAVASIARDVAIGSAFPFCKDALIELRKDSSTGNPADGPLAGSRLEDIARRCRVLREQVGRTYRDEVIQRLRSLLQDDGKAKEDQLYLTMNLATDLATGGYSLQHLRTVGEELTRGSQPFIERFDQLVSSCTNADAKFQVLFVVREWEQGVLPTRQGSWIALRDDAKQRVSQSPRAADFFGKATPSDHVVSLEAEALDPFAARASAEAALTNDFAAIAFNSFRDPKLSVNGEALVIDTDGSDLAMLSSADGTRRGALRRSIDWRERTEALLRMEELLKPDDVRHLSATLQYFRLAVTHQSDEVRLVNLWVAAETLVRRSGTGSTLSRVTSAMAPLLAIRNVRRVTRGLARRLTSAIRFKDLRHVGLIVDRKAKQIEPLQLLETLKDETRGKAVLALLDHDPLLRLRLARLADRALKSGASAAAYFEANALNIEWQLGRIYRARNAIVHRGEAPRSTRQLLQHLETYVWTAIRQVTDELARAEGRWSLSDSLEHWRSLYAHAIRVLKASEDAPLKALTEPSLFFALAVPPSPQPAGKHHP
jgi:hypothetical protein